MCSFFTIFFFFLLLLLTCMTQILCSKPVLSSGRRILHEPFQPLGSLPPAPPPNPPPPSPPAPPNAKYPFSTTTPNQSPFFPNYPSPPPPPSPASFASFPANISSLILPHASKSKSSSGKLLGVAIGVGVCAIVLAGVSAFVYCRRRRKQYSADEKTLRSDSSLRLFPSSAESGNGGRKVGHTSSTSSEFLYLGTIVNSRGVEDRSGSRANDAGRGGRTGGGGGGSGGGGAAAVDPRKMDSPELRPLPPLARQGSRQQNGVARDDVGSNLADDEEEEFYSPKGSLGGHESSNGTGSGSRRVFAAIASDNFVGRSSESSSSSYSSSTSGSPDRSHSISLSPPASLSPKRSQPKSRESIVVDSSPLLTSSPLLPQPPPPAHPQTEVHSVEGSLSSSSDRSQFSLSPVHNQHVQSSSMSSLSSTPERASGRDGKSPLLSPLSLSPNRAVGKNPDGEARASGVTFENVHSSSSSSPVSSSPERCVESDAPERQDEIFSYSSSGLPNASPDRNAEKISHGSPRLSTTSPEKNVEKILSSSPQRNSEKISLESPRLSPASCEGGAEAVLCASPRLSNASSGRNVQKISCASPRLSNASNQSEKSLSSSSAFSLPSSPEKVVEHGLDHSPSLSNVSDRYRQSPMPKLLSSPERESYNTSVHSATVERVLDQTRDSPAPPPLQPQRKHWEIPILSSIFGQPERVDKVLDQNAESPAPPAPPQRKHWEIPVFSTPIAQPKVSPPPPPPLPPHQRTRKQWEIPSPSTPTDQSVSRPPALVPPSKSFVLPNPTTDVSPVQLPPNSQEQNLRINEETPKPKLKPLHWDKVRANSDRETVWDQLRSSSFKLNEEMIETLFVVNTPTPKSKDTTPRSVLPTPKQEDRVLDPKKSQNIAILLRALNVTVEEVCEALLEGSADTLGTELLESLLKMAPSKEEERKLKEHKEDSPTKLGPAEKFLKAVLDVPFAFRRVEAMLYIANFESEVEYLGKSFETLEAACEELRNSRMLLKLLEAVLKTGNRMNVGTNRGDALAFKLDTLLKLVDVKGADGKTTLLHFVVQEIIRTEGSRLLSTSQTPNSSSLSEDAKCRRLGLQVVSSLSSGLANVKKAAAMDSEVLNGDVSKLSKGISYITEVVKLNEATKHDESGKKFTESMNKFMRMAEEEILKIQAQESVALSLVKEITEYFHGNLAKEEAHPFRIFMVVRDFLSVLDRVCKEVCLINERTMVSSAHRFPVPVNPMLPQPLNPMLPQPLPGLFGKRQYSTSDDDSSSA